MHSMIYKYYGILILDPIVRLQHFLCVSFRLRLMKVSLLQKI
jgi:hypothetical protein